MFTINESQINPGVLKNPVNNKEYLWYERTIGGRYNDGPKSYPLPESKPASDSFYDRLLMERSELKEKIIKLREFMLSEKWDILPDVQKDLMEFQITSMEDYHYFLRQRIALL